MRLVYEVLCSSGSPQETHSFTFGGQALRSMIVQSTVFFEYSIPPQQKIRNMRLFQIKITALAKLATNKGLN
jgi:hypothetical protein